MKNVLITGGAGGIGSAIAKRFIKEGFVVYSFDLNTINLGENFHNIICDVTSIEDIKKVKETIKDVKFSHIITLAGRALKDEWDTFDKMNPYSIAESVNLNLCGHLNVIRLFLSQLDKEDKNRSIILMSSINAYGGFGLPVYSASKAGLIGFCKTMRPELIKQGIRINTICPGTIVTDATLTEKKDFTELLKSTKLGRFMTKEEVADLAYELCEQSSKTGEVINIDAGQNEVVNGGNNNTK